MPASFLRRSLPLAAALALLLCASLLPQSALAAGCDADLPGDADLVDGHDDAGGMCSAPPAVAADAPVDLLSLTTLQRVRARGRLVCAHCDDTLGHSLLAHSPLNDTASGMEPELCAGLAAALGVKASYWRMLTPSERFPLLQSRNVDVAFALTSKTVGRDMLERGSFSIPYFQDQHNIMYRSDAGIDSAQSLGGAVLCVTAGTTNPNVLGDYLASIRSELGSGEVRMRTVPSDLEALELMRANECQGFVNDDSVVAGYVSSVTPPDGVTYLLASWPGTPFARAPFSALTLDGDAEFASIVDWFVNSLFLAEMYGITCDNVEAKSADDSIPGEAQRLLGRQLINGQTLPFDMKAAIAVIGNYAELYERNFGSFLPRSRANQLYQNGGAVFPGGFR